MDYQKKIRRINLLNKLLEQEFISLKKSIKDVEALEEINIELREFLQALLEEALGTRTPVKASASFSEQEVTVLKQFVTQTLAKATTPARPVKPTPPPAPPKSPIVMALEDQGYNIADMNSKELDQLILEEKQRRKA